MLTCVQGASSGALDSADFCVLTPLVCSALAMHHGGAVDLLRRLRSLLPYGVLFCTILGAVSLAAAGPVAAGLRPDPPKIPPPPPPPSMAVPQEPAPLPPAPVAPPSPAPVAPTPSAPVASATSRTPSPGAIRPSAETAAARRVRVAARARLRDAGLRAHAWTAAAPTVSRRQPPFPAAESDSRWNATAAVAIAVPVACVGLLLVGAVLVRAGAVPWPEPARVLDERRDELVFAGLGILAATAVSFLLLLMTP